LYSTVAELYGYLPATRNRTWLIRRIAWKLQEREHGGLSERAQARAAELAANAELRVTAPKAKTVASERTVVIPVTFDPDGRLPIAGGLITRQYKGRALQVKVLDRGFEYEGERFKSLSAVAKHITGTHTNGYLFFRLNGGAA
jgi:hypothetical protein